MVKGFNETRQALKGYTCAQKIALCSTIHKLETNVLRKCDEKIAA
jgi:hypothetical protein